MPNANGCMPSCSTRYIGRMLAIISDEMSVNRLVNPRAHTVPLTAGSQPARAPGDAWVAVRFRVRASSVDQSMAYMDLGPRRYRQSASQAAAPNCWPGRASPPNVSPEAGLWLPGGRL